jgi:hypothetical protein
MELLAMLDREESVGKNKKRKKRLASPTLVVTAAEAAAVEKDVECAICLCDVEDEDKSFMKCSHVFHGSCLDAWTNKCLLRRLYPSCPTCRAEL